MWKKVASYTFHSTNSDSQGEISSKILIGSIFLSSHVSNTKHTIDNLV